MGAEHEVVSRDAHRDALFAKVSPGSVPTDHHALVGLQEAKGGKGNALRATSNNPEAPAAVVQGAGDLLALQNLAGQTVFSVGNDGTSSITPAAIGALDRAADVQVFTTSGTWTKPAGANLVEVVCVSGGGGGGSGRRGAAGSVRCGGGGGAGGGASTVNIRGADLGATVSVTVGAGGTGGATVTANDTNGTPGGAGGLSSFGTFCRTIGGGAGGAGGSTTGGAGGAAATNQGGAGPSMAGGNASATGGLGTNGAGAGAAAAGWQYAGCGGGAGGGITAADVAANGTPGGNPAYQSNQGGVGGVVDSTLPTAFNTASPGPGGGPGGGGAASITTAAQAGATGGLYGAGGGGGGASLNGNNSGAGGAGSPGVVVVIAHLQSPSDTGDWVSWGDSLTQGAGGGSTSYPSVLSGLLSRTVTNMGVGGETSSQIAARAGGRPAALTATGATIPGGTAVTVTTVPSIPSVQGGPISGAVVGVRGTLTYSAGAVSFRRQEAVQGSTACPDGSVFTPDAALASRYIRQIVWAGRNNYTDMGAVLADIAAIVAFGRTGKYVVLSVLNGNYGNEVKGGSGYNALVSLNQQLAVIYGASYLDIRRYLIDHGLADAGITPTQQDLTDMGNDIPPASLRSDNIHLNAAGYTVVAQQVAAKIQALGY